VKERISKFKDEVKTSLDKLFITSNYKYCGTISGIGRTALNVLASDDNMKGWPSILWDEEETRVKDEIMSVMDEVQKMYLAPIPDLTGDVPEEKGE
jgi:hypothetical protein